MVFRSVLTAAELEFLRTSSSPNLNKKCVQLSDAAPSHEVFKKIYFLAKP